jgi:hypothetical protein
LRLPVKASSPWWHFRGTLPLGVGLWRLSIRPDVVTRDSKEFDEALSTWHPLIFAKLSTPRRIKRFMNRVRYVAMLQRRDERDVTLLERALAWIRRALAWIRRVLSVKKAAPPREVVAQPVREDQVVAKPIIPETILVALSAIEYSHPEWLQDGKLASDPWGVTGSEALPDDIAALLADPARLEQLANYREEYLKMSAGVHVT